MPKLTALARARVSLSSWATGSGNFRRGEGVDVLPGAVGVEQERVLREVGHEAQLDLRVVGGEEQVAGPAGMKAARISRPSAVRTGMFCRLGLVDERRPVAVPTWLNVVWTRPSESTRRGSESRYVERSLASWRCSRTSAGTGDARRTLRGHPARWR